MSDRPSDRAIAQAFWEIRPSVVCDAVPFRRSVIERATELDATAAPAHTCDFTDGLDTDCQACHPAPAAPVVVGEDVMAKAWRNLYIAERMRSIEFEGMSYEMRRAHAEASANDFEDEFRERMAKPAAKTAMGGLTAALAGD